MTWILVSMKWAQFLPCKITHEFNGRYGQCELHNCMVISTLLSPPPYVLSLSAYGYSDTFVVWQREEDIRRRVVEGKRGWDLDWGILPEDKQAACQKTKSKDPSSLPFP